MKHTHRELIRTVEEYADSHRMLECTDIIVGYSGGADSSLLLYSLHSIAQRRGIRLTAAHVNHMFRGEAADSDEAFCRSECGRLEIPFCSLRIDVASIARERSQSDEECARDIRYGFFSDISDEIKKTHPDAVVRIATAHNATDNAETVLFNIARGTALSGLCGIPPVRPDGVIRPILLLPKERVLSYCSELGIEYVTDATNEQTVYTRNRIRHTVLPQLRTVNPSLEKSVARMTDTLREDADCLDREARSVYRSLCVSDCRILARDSLLSCHRAIRSRVLCLFISDNSARFEHTHIETCLSLLSRGGDFSVSLIGRKRLECIGGELRVTDDTRERMTASDGWILPLHMGENILPCGGKIFISGDRNYIEEIKTQKVYRLFIQQALSGDTIDNAFCARSRREGDRILSGGHTHKVKKLLSEHKIPQQNRGSVPVIERDGRVVWIAGVRCADGEGKCEHRLYFAYAVE